MRCWEVENCLQSTRLPSPSFSPCSHLSRRSCLFSSEAAATLSAAAVLAKIFRGDANQAVNIHKAFVRSICVTCLQVRPAMEAFQIYVRVLLTSAGATESTMPNKELEQHRMTSVHQPKWPSVAHSPRRSRDPPLRNHCWSWREASTTCVHHLSCPRLHSQYSVNRF